MTGGAEAKYSNPVDIDHGLDPTGGQRAPIVVGNPFTIAPWLILIKSRG